MYWRTATGFANLFCEPSVTKRLGIHMYWQMLLVASWIYFWHLTTKDSSVLFFRYYVLKCRLGRGCQWPPVGVYRLYDDCKIIFVFHLVPKLRNSSPDCDTLGLGMMIIEKIKKAKRQIWVPRSWRNSRVRIGGSATTPTPTPTTTEWEDIRRSNLESTESRRRPKKLIMLPMLPLPNDITAKESLGDYEEDDRDPHQWPSDQVAAVRLAGIHWWFLTYIRIGLRYDVGLHQ
jgi:hypothetical protein